MAARAKVPCGLIVFLLIFGARFHCGDCQEAALQADLITDESRTHSQQLLQTGASLTVEDPSEATWTTSDANRRRTNGRKRKRRPTVSTTEANPWRAAEESLPAEASQPVAVYQRRRSPIKERIREPLAALEKEQKLSEIRDKQRKEFVAAVTAGYRDKSYRKPYSSSTRKETEDSISPKPTADLKNILKNSSGGLSLSEILQQKNLSLDDLLKGKQNALLAIQSTVTPSTSGTGTSKYVKPARRIPPSFLPTTTWTTSPNRDNFQTIEISSTLQTAVRPEVVSISNLRQRPLESDEEEPDNSSKIAELATRRNIIFPGLAKSRITTTTTTASDQDVEFETGSIKNSSSTTTTTTTTTHKPLYKKRLPFRPRTRTPPLFKDFTSSSSMEAFSDFASVEESHEDETEAVSTSTTTTTTTTPQSTPAAHDVDERLKETPESNFVDVADDSFDEPYLKPETDYDHPPSSYSSITDRIDRLESDVETTPKRETPFVEFGSDDHTDLLELIEDRRSGNRLFKILAQRNMTLEELFDHRRRGSSELHLAQLAENQTAFEAKSPPSHRRIYDDKLDIVTAFENFPHFNLVDLKSIKPDEIKTDSQGASYFTSIIDIEPTDEVMKEERALKGNPTMQAQRTEKSLNFFPSWKTLALASLTSQEALDHEAPAARHATHQKQIDPVERIENEVARAHDLLDLELSGHGFKRSSSVHTATTTIPSGIRSAIVASAAIVGTSLCTFVVIFMISRWRQRRRQRLDYTETYNAMKSKLPVISRQSTMKRMEEFSPHPSPIIFPGSASQCSSKLNTMDPNSPEVQEYLFDALRKPF